MKLLRDSARMIMMVGLRPALWRSSKPYAASMSTMSPFNKNRRRVAFPCLRFSSLSSYSLPLAETIAEEAAEGAVDTGRVVDGLARWVDSVVAVVAVAGAPQAVTLEAGVALVVEAQATHGNG